MTGTSMRTPTAVAKAAPEDNPKSWEMEFDSTGKQARV